MKDKSKLVFKALLPSHKRKGATIKNDRISVNPNAPAS
jgi:hypothetical protein